jgi:hypothetical protein
MTMKSKKGWFSTKNIALLLLPLLLISSASSDDLGKWVSIFDGKTLAGWSSLDMSFWSVRDGAITGETTREHNPKQLLFIVSDVKADDFELRFKYRLIGPQANSGMQFRSKYLENGEVHGYQADMANNGPYTGGIWDEFGTRNSLAACGEKTEIGEQGKKTVSRFAEAADLLKRVDHRKWNEYRIIAQGPHVVLKINGKVTADLTDREAGKALSSGIFAMAVVPGEPMTAQFKDIQIKRLKSAGNR